MSKVKEVSKDFELISVGLVYASACSKLSPKDTEARINVEHSTGLEGGWKLADEPFADGTPNPTLCNLKPETHKHYLFNC